MYIYVYIYILYIQMRRGRTIHRREDRRATAGQAVCTMYIFTICTCIFTICICIYTICIYSMCIVYMYILVCIHIQEAGAYNLSSGGSKSNCWAGCMYYIYILYVYIYIYFMYIQYVYSIYIYIYILVCI